ncbi:MAG: hypothetical protein QMD09_11055 [Desulfatibacillaceae bacterium]|nr:hypothetical protein [Desulfatibacillaceae bacterium]
MGHDRVLASLNLFAVLQNLEELVRLDPQAADLCADWNVSMRFSVFNGPAAWIGFDKGSCTVKKGLGQKADIALKFLSCRHLNLMFESKRPPIITRGITRLPFLLSKFPKLTKRLEYYLKPDEKLLETDELFRRMNTILTLNTAAFAAVELAALDPVCQHIASAIPQGAVLLKILPDGPAVSISINKDGWQAKKGDIENPAAKMLLKDMDIAGAFLNQKLDIFCAIASGAVAISGNIPMLDNLGLILDRIPLYLA